MATLQKFKFLATQCAVAGSPSRSPTTSPVIHLRRRKTLRMFLSRAGSGGAGGRRRDDEPLDHHRKPKSAAGDGSPEKIKQQLAVRGKLKDFFVSSPPPPAGVDERGVENIRERFLRREDVLSGGGVLGGRRGGVRPLSAALRQRLMRRAWRPVLVAIPEYE